MQTGHVLFGTCPVPFIYLTLLSRGAAAIRAVIADAAVRAGAGITIAVAGAGTCGLGAAVFPGSAGGIA